MLPPVKPRSFNSLSEAEEENGQSRIYLGIHWNFDDSFGQAMGRSVGDWVFDHVAGPKHLPTGAHDEPSTTAPGAPVGAGGLPADVLEGTHLPTFARTIPPQASGLASPSAFYDGTPIARLVFASDESELGAV